MNSPKTNKFKVGDKVKIISLDNTDDNWGLTEDMYSVDDEAVVLCVETHDTVTLCDGYLYHVSDLELVEHASETSQVQGESEATKEMIASPNELIGSLSKLDVILPKNGEDDFSCCLGKGIESKTYNPLVAQEGGGHYKDKGIQPLEYTMQNNLSFCEGNVVKYISRYKSKNGIEDLAKVIHYALLASYEEYGEEGSTELKDKILKLLGVSE